MVHIKHRTKGRVRVEVRGEPRYRSRSLRRVQRKTPSGRTVTHYKKRTPGKARCALCGKALHGIKRGRPAKIRRTFRTKRTVQRPFGANLCSSCTRKVLKWRADLKHKLARPDDVPIYCRQYVGVK